MKTKSLEPIPFFNAVNSIKPLISTYNKKYSIDDINSYQDALNVLGEEPKQYPSWFTKRDIAGVELETIIKAHNYIDNGNKLWIPDFNDRNTPKYINWLEKTQTGSVLVDVRVYNSVLHGAVWLTFKEGETAKKVYNKFTKEYNDYFGW